MKSLHRNFYMQICRDIIVPVQKKDTLKIKLGNFLDQRK